MLKINPFRDIWLKPRATMRAILDNDKYANVQLFIITYVIFSSIIDIIDFIIDNSSFSLIYIIGFALASLISLYVFIYYLFPMLIKWTGKLFDGRGELDDIRCYVAWSSFLATILLIFTFLGDFIIIEDDFFIIIKQIIIILFIIFLIVNNTKLLAEAQGLSAWKALGNLTSAVTVVVMAIFTAITVFALVVKIASGV